MKRKYILNIPILLALLLLLNACEEEKYAIPTTKDALQNDVIKRSLGPNLVGQNIEFTYAMALPETRGKLESAQVEASIEGATGTYLENNSYSAGSNGADVGVKIGEPSVTEGKITKVTFSADTMAATLRYFYRIPEAARGQSVTFKFTANSSNGETVSYSMGPYNISKMDMKLDLAVKDGDAAYISIEDMAVYNAAAAEANAGKIDLVYLHRTTPTSFAHALVAPATDAQYRPGITLPAGVNRNTKINKVWALRDQQLARAQFGVFIDDLDFQQLNIADAPNFALNMRAESGIWVETADGKYRAYVYVNSINNTAKSAVISIKRFTL
ncbi:DUF4466 family protein [Adhaeribacter rhizoryzae]|uniref:DUF4466 domain-containing protein n=1 Tax=Adhaeribacter rhizoryzae TaxID=2607907 RepID=A0A5M6D8Q2_9BACT|nr:DUF4466 family protein [Adhaeribacter rhizoryzae]KAA5542860.1 DUF4466 domain-containing protein [Adhaeribacter rhizoryzae]